jgi:signal transduction histidine kinase
MPIDISSVLHVLAHELRTPTGIAQGYLRMLLDERLSDPDDRQRALTQAQQALARISELTHESTRLAAWLEDSRGRSHVDAAALIAQIVAGTGLEPPLVVQSSVSTSNTSIPTCDATALVGAMVTLVKATARELGQHPCTLAADVSSNTTRRDRHFMQVLIGRADQLPALVEGPDAAGAAPLALERGGLGLSLVSASAVLDAHGATPWTLEGSRSTVGIRLPLEERARL